MKVWICPKCRTEVPVFRSECGFCGFEVIDPRSEDLEEGLV